MTTAPHSRHTGLDEAAVRRTPGLKVLASSPEAGIFALSTGNGKQIFITGHPEYDAGTLRSEYERDLAEGRPIALPQHYFPDDDPARAPQVTWRSHANLLYSNWLNYFVYQTTPYDLSQIK